jgi:hypothetical protein
MNERNRGKKLLKVNLKQKRYNSKVKIVKSSMDTAKYQVSNDPKC